MQNENENLGTALDGIEAVSTAPQAAPPDLAPTPSAPAPQTNSVSIPQSAFAKLKEEQRQRGKREAMSELEAKFKAAGFGSLDDALAALADTRKAPAAPAKAAPQKQQAETPQYERGGDDRQITRIQKERERLAKMHAQEQARARKLQRQLEAKEAEMALREAAVSHGVKDVDYALRLLQRELDGKTEAELAGFDESAFFGQKLRTSHPYLFGELVVPATTGTGRATPAAPAPSTVQAATGTAGQFNAQKATAADFRKELMRRGLTVGL